ncbi:MAG: HNH endonuclease [Oscillospiraceae bacterium]|nr:HNH endonuclease [Oscillospiraceae bacterium]
MKRACSRCGKIHDFNYRCTKGKRYESNDAARKLRSSWAWREKSLDVRDRAFHVCEVCKAQGKITIGDVAVHHIVKVRDNKDLYLDDDNLVCLCDFHHKQAEQGDIDPDYLRTLAEARDRKTPPLPTTGG